MRARNIIQVRSAAIPDQMLVSAFMAQIPDHVYFKDRELGFAGYLLKPVTQRDLTDCLLLAVSVHPEDWHTQTHPIITQQQLRTQRGREKRRILVAEDNVVNQKVAVRTLEKLGSHTINGAELECHAAGMDEFITKPVARERLEDCLERLLSDADTMRGELEAARSPVQTQGDPVNEQVTAPLDLEAVARCGNSESLAPLLTELHHEVTRAIEYLRPHQG